MHLRQLSQAELKLAWTGMQVNFDQIEEWHQSGLSASSVASGSLLEIADAMTDPHQVSHLLIYLIHTAVDHLHALKTLLTDAEAQHTFAPFTLIRGSIEASSSALWILGDSNPRQVTQRALHLEYQNLWDQRRASKLVDKDADFDPDSWAIFKDVLSRNDLTVSAIRNPPHVSKMIAHAADTFSLKGTLLTWQMCSAAAHGRSWAKQFLTLFESYSDDGVSKTISGQLSSNTLAMAIALNNACEVLAKAQIVGARHSRNPNHTGSSFTKTPSKLQIVTRGLIIPN